MASVGENKVFCPYCGAEMNIMNDAMSLFGIKNAIKLYWYKCSNKDCESESPAKETEEKAYKAAVKRYEEPNRILMIDEMTSAKRCFVEWKGTFDVEECGAAIVVSDINPETWKEEKKLKLYMKSGAIYNRDLSSYGVTVRCWKKNPTSDDYDNVEWLPEKKQEDDDDE